MRTTRELDEAIIAAKGALREYAHETHRYDNLQECLSNLLCDLKHFAERNKLDWNEALSYAYRHFAAEGGGLVPEQPATGPNNQVR